MNHFKLTRQQRQSNPNSKLTGDDITAIRRLKASGVLIKDIAPQFKVSPSTIGALLKWGRVPKGEG